MDLIRRQNSEEEVSRYERVFSFGIFGTLAFVTAAIIVLVMLGYLIYSGVLKKQVNDLTSSVQDKKNELAKPESIETFKKVQKIRSADVLLGKRHIGSRAISLLETRLSPDVAISNFNMDVEKGLITLSAETTDFFKIAVQIANLMSDSKVKSAFFSQVSKSEKNRLTFDLEITLDPSLLSGVAMKEGEN